MRPVGLGSPPVIRQVDIVGGSPPATSTGASEQLRLPDAPLSSTQQTHLGGGLPPAALAHHLDASMRVFSSLLERPLPADLGAMMGMYEELGLALAKAEACLLSALDALDPKTGGGRASPDAPFVELRERAFGALRTAGKIFDHLEPAFSKNVHGSNGWPNRPVEVDTDRGDGRPLFHYRNTYKKGRELDVDERRAEHQKRVARYESEGGDWSLLALADESTVARMHHAVRYDYVMSYQGGLRMVPRTDEHGNPQPDPGHTLLATGGPGFDDKPVLLAGELWCLRDSAGEIEAVFVANNSGHFKPEYEDLVNAVAVLEGLGVPRDKVVLFGGPNNLPSLFEETAEKHGVSGRLPPPATQILDEWRAAEAKNALSVRF